MQAERLRIFRLVPDAPADDPGWDIAPPVGEVIVRAHSPADARIVAAGAEVDYPDLQALPGDGVETAFASALRDDKLYRVEEDGSGRFPAEGERQVLEAPAASTPVIKPEEE